MMAARLQATGATCEIRNIVRRIAALLLLEPRLDANHLAVQSGTFDWPT